MSIEEHVPEEDAIHLDKDLANKEVHPLDQAEEPTAIASPKPERSQASLSTTWRVFNSAAKLGMLLIPLGFVIYANWPGRIRFNFGSQSSSYASKLNVGSGTFRATQFETTAAGFPRRYLLRQFDVAKDAEYLWWSGRDFAVNIGLILILALCLLYQYFRSRREIPFWQLSILQILCGMLLIGGLVTWIQQRKSTLLSGKSNIANSNGITLRSAYYSPFDKWSDGINALTFLSSSWSVEAEVANPNDKALQGLGNEQWLERISLVNLNDDQFAKLPQLKLLRSVECQSSTIGPKALAWFQSLPNLQWLDLQKCDCKAFPDDTFEKLGRVECFDLRGSSLPSGMLDKSNFLKELRAFYVDSKQISKGFWASFDGHANLKVLMIDWRLSDSDRQMMKQGDVFAGKTINVKLHDMPNLETVRIPYAPMRLELANLPNLKIIEPIRSEQSIFDIPSVGAQGQFMMPLYGNAPGEIRSNPSPFAKDSSLLIRACSIKQCPKLDLPAVLPLTDDNVHQIEGPIGQLDLAIIADRKGKRLTDFLQKLQSTQMRGSLSIHMKGETRIDTKLIPAGLQNLCIEGLRVDDAIPAMDQLKSLSGLVFRGQITLDQFESCLYDIPHLQRFEAQGPFHRVAVRDRYELTSLKVGIERVVNHCDIELLGCTGLRECKVFFLGDTYTLNLEDARQLGDYDMLTENDGKPPKCKKFVLGGDHNLNTVIIGPSFEFGTKPLKQNLSLAWLEFNFVKPTVITEYLTQVNPTTIRHLEINGAQLNDAAIASLAKTKAPGLELNKQKVIMPEMAEVLFHNSRREIEIKASKIELSESRELTDLFASDRLALATLYLDNAEIDPAVVVWMAKNLTVDQIYAAHCKFDLPSFLPILIGQKGVRQVDRAITISDDMLSDEFYAALAAIKTPLQIGVIDYAVPPRIAAKMPQHRFFQALSE